MSPPEEVSPLEQPSPTAESCFGQDLQVDSREHSDTASAHGDAEDDAISLTTTIASTVQAFRYQHGRRYHAFDENAYWLPNDDIEIGRLEIQHYVWRLTLGGCLHISPVPANVERVVDIGTGTGQWVIEFAVEHPDAQVLGTDLSPIQPTWAPPNCSFLVENAEDEWVFEDRYDFVHSRMLLMGIHDWPRYFRQAWQNLKPGGWVEVQEVQFPVGFANDGSVKPDSALLVWSQRVREAAGKAGIDTMVTERFVDMVKAHGFVNIRAEPIKWPIGAWAKGQKEKMIGKLTLENTRQFISPIALALWTKQLGWSKEQVEEVLLDVRKDLDNPKTHYYWQMYILSAQKPETAE